MSKLASKVQYKNFETGEFNNIAFRTVEETIDLLEKFPWNEQRNLTSVDLTCPSITIEHSSGSFLKIGHYFNAKYCLYSLTKNRILRSRVITNLHDCYPIISDFYSGIDLLADSEKSYFVFNPGKYFVTRSFEYTLTAGRIFNFLLFPTGFLTLLALAILTVGFSFSSYTTLGTSVAIGFFMVFNGCNIYLFFNYYFFTKNWYLKISKGNDRFFWGMKNNVKEYSKTDIESINQFKNPAPRNPWNDNIIYKIRFKDGEQIQFPNLLIGETDFHNKFPEHKIISNGRFLPTIHQETHQILSASKV